MRGPRPPPLAPHQGVSNSSVSGLASLIDGLCLDGRWSPKADSPSTASSGYCSCHGTPDLSASSSADIFVFPEVVADPTPETGRSREASADLFWMKVIDDFDWERLNMEIWVIIWRD